MTTPATTPAPQKITPQSMPVFPCWLWIPKIQVVFPGWLYYFAKVETVLMPHATHWLPDGPEPTCTPTEGENRPFVEREMAKLPLANGQVPTHSAQEAAERAARECLRDQIGTDGDEGDVKAFTAIILRHFPTQSQQPSVSPGSGEALREAQRKWTEQYALTCLYIEKTCLLEKTLGDLVDAVNVEFPGGLSNIGGKTGPALIAAVDALASINKGGPVSDRLKELREQFAQPATPPLTSGEDWRESGRAWSKELDATLGNPLDVCACGHTRDHHDPYQGLHCQGQCNVGRGDPDKKRCNCVKFVLSAPPLPSIGGGKDGLMEALKKIERMSSDRNRDGDSLMFEAGCIARDALRSAQSPQSGREEK